MRYLLLLFSLINFISLDCLAIDVPRSPGSQSNVARPGSTASWTSMGNVTSSDGAYATTNANLASINDFTDYLVLTNFSFNIPSTSIIKGITISISRKQSNSNKLIDDEVRLVVGGSAVGANRAGSTNWSTSLSTETYGSATDMWGQTLTHTTVNASNFGFQIAVFRNSNTTGPSQRPEIDFAQVTVSYNSTLPVDLISFTATALSNGQQKLDWSTATEINSSKFYVQAADAKTKFETIAEIRAGGNSQSQLDYQFIDNRLTREPLLYYRLIQEDYNGDQEIFPIVSVKPVLLDEVLIFPNPVQNKLQIQLKDGVFDEIESISISNSSGVLLDRFVQVQNLSVNFDTYSAGHYLVTIRYKGISSPEVHPFVKL